MHGLEICVRLLKGKRREFIQAYEFFLSKSQISDACKHKKELG
jgi:hypothetical protein